VFATNSDFLIHISLKSSGLHRYRLQREFEFVAKTEFFSLKIMNSLLRKPLTLNFHEEKKWKVVNG